MNLKEYASEEPHPPAPVGRVASSSETDGGTVALDGATLSRDSTPGAHTAAVSERAGDRIGRYKLLQELGEGGCGIVYMAEQEEPVRRRVALKVIKLGMDTRNVIARFEAERQALALMDHPNIARVLDAGATAGGRPFFVMELVRGVKITEYCDQHNLPAAERLRLFIQVCQAIQHAHQKGVVHRDIKPTNILVTLHDGVPVPKVIDFGIAKATDRRLTDKTIFTEFQSFIGTPAYMSPEQAEMSGLDIDTRSDVYSLGVLLYELLTGRTPLDAETLASSGLDGVRQIIREQEPPRPSVRVRGLSGLELTTMAHRRHTEAPRLISLLSGDLDWIVMKCLEKDRTRRYETANELAMDVQRYLRNEPVLARPPSKLYRFRKLIRRNQALFGAAAGITIALVAGLAMATGSFLRERLARERAVAAEYEQARLRAEAESARAGEAVHRQQAEREELRARRIAYASDMTLAREALRYHNIGRASAILDRHRPAPGQTDLRGWEWRYLWQYCQDDALFTLCQRTNSVRSLSASPDGRWLAVGELTDGGLTIWDVRSRQQYARLPAGRREVLVAFSPAAPLLAFSVVDTNRQASVRLWDAAARRAGAELLLAGNCQGLVFSRDGSKLLTASAGAEGEIALWQMPEGRKILGYKHRIAQPRGTPLAIAPDASFAVCAGSQGEFHVIDLASGQVRWKAKAAAERVTALAVSPDGSTIASGAGYAEGSVRLWEASSGRELALLDGHRAWVSQCVFWPDGKTLATASADQSIRLWDLPTLKPAGALHGHSLEVWGLLLLPDHATLISGCKDGSVRVWDSAAIRHERSYLTLPEPVRHFRFSPDGKWLYTLDRAGRLVRWGCADFSETKLLADWGQGVATLRISPDGRFLAVGSSLGIVRLWDVVEDRLMREWAAHKGEAQPQAFVSSRPSLVTVGFGEGRGKEWDLATGAELASWSAPRSGYLAMSPDGRWVAALDGGGSFWLRDLRTGRESTHRLDINESYSCGFSPDSKLLAASSEHGFVKLWNIPELTEAATLTGYLLGTHSVAFSPADRRLAAGSGGVEAVKLWDLETGQEVLTLEGQGSIFGSTLFSPDGRTLASRNGDGILHLYRAPTWDEIEQREKGRATPIAR